ncbi:carbohydrate ABC transporter permease [Paenibacillus sp. R14(2021)]|uniref:carbohydrate ABC transporter permease n=1 Tax=Paenibacillus sp. R14(2021) TaxID=2859228 RepID=UPI002158990F|nr:carbohydrate ABC transporter permease [Paenibacillus sp. R14(2021)]
MISRVKQIPKHILLSVFGLMMVYPILWLFFGSFKNNDEIFGNVSLFPKGLQWSNYHDGWFAINETPFHVFFANSFILSFTILFGSIFSCSFAAYGFARISFPLKKVWFGVLMITIMFPKQIIIIPQFLMFANLGWLNSYLPMTIPAWLGEFNGAFFIFLLIQFIRGIPLELDEAAIVDGSGRVRFFFLILLPLLKPALFTISIFAFMWSWDDFFSHLLYINSVSKYPVTLALNMFLDNTGKTNWGAMFSMSFLSILPLLLIFFFAQKHFVEGISTTGLKG